MDTKIEAIYDIKKINSHVRFEEFETIDKIDRAAVDIGNGMCVLWLYSGIETIEITNGKFVLETKTDLLKYIVKARLFNDKKEWHIWRTSKGLQGRLREDNVNGHDEIEYIESDLPLESVVAKPLNDLGISGNNLKLVTRNYIGYQNIQAGYTDMRFVGFKE